MATHSTASTRYTNTAIVLHWTIAILIIFNLSFGFFMEDYPPVWRIRVILLHISSGITVLVLTVIRVVWRLIHEPPAYPNDMKSWERHSAHLAHFALYACMVIMPLTGWTIISAHPPEGSAGAAYEAAQKAPPTASTGTTNAPPPAMRKAVVIKLWYLIPLPLLSPIEEIGATPGGLEPQTILHDKFVHWHEIGAWILIALLLLHVAAALKHQLIDKHREFARMGIGKLEVE